MKVNVSNGKFVVKQDNSNNLREMRRCEARNRNNRSKNYHCYCGLHNKQMFENKSEHKHKCSCEHCCQEVEHNADNK